MKKLEDKKLLVCLLNILLFIAIIKICKVTGFCFTIINLISPLFFGYIISWIIRPVIEYFKKRGVSIVISTILIYLVSIGLIILLFVTILPRIINDLKELLPTLEEFIDKNEYLRRGKELLINGSVSSKALGNINDSFKNIFASVSTIIYSVIISFFLSVHQLKISNKFFKKIPTKLLNKINKNLRIYVKGTFLDMLVLFFMASVAFFFAGLPSFLTFAFLIALTNIIPYIGPYIGGLPAILVGLSVSSKMGLIILIIIVVLQVIEGCFLQPFIMSKSLKLSPILIIMGLIIFSHFFGIFGMLISTPLVSIIKIFYDYYKKNKPEWFIKVLGRL